MRTTSLVVVTAALGTLAACVGSSGGAGAPVPGERRGVPGFDTREYPGDTVMDRWRDASPYRWVGFYLPAPCYTGTSWQGRRARLRSSGWGLAVLFVGEQDWAAVAPAPEEAADSTALRCTRQNLGAERGRADGHAAATAAADEGFPRGTTIFLDVERVDSVARPLAEYVGGWAGALLEDGRFHPGVYAHAENADRLHGLLSAAFRAAGRVGSPALWVAAPGGFNLRRGPTESGFPAATIWQGRLDVTETWGGATVRLDANVSTSSNPSG